MLDSLEMFLIMALIFIPLERLSQAEHQKLFRKGWVKDTALFFLNSILSQILLGLSLNFAIQILNPIMSTNLRITVSSAPAIVQYAGLILIVDTFYYIAHRLTHEVPLLWKFHATHHSSEELDWLSTARFHPLDQVFLWTFTLLPVYLLGFSNIVLGVFLTVWLFQNFLSHSNTTLRFGIIDRILVTPAYHRIHHDSNTTRHANYAGQVGFMDYICGTFRK